MNEENTIPHDFKSDYEQLELDDRASWDQARANYRRLVHLWHPDKYAQRPRERKHAQQQFILLTKSYDNLKTFERKNGRLPFEPAKSQYRDDEPDPRTSDCKTKNSSAVRQDFDNLSPGALGRDHSATDAAVIKPASTGTILWVVGGVCLLLVTSVTFFLLDRSANQKVIEYGREAIRDAPESEFMPSAAEIRKGESRGAFIKPTK